jgi:hypothetical protein
MRLKKVPFYLLAEIVPAFAASATKQTLQGPKFVPATFKRLL